MRIFQPLLIPTLLLLASCTSVPFDYPRKSSLATPASSETVYGRQVAVWREQHGAENSGFVPLELGMDALGTRLILAENAQATIDAQYFLIKPDKAGELFLGKLLRAAERGVRVRLLIDDIFTPRHDTILAVFNSHPNIQVRLFNPVSRASPTAWSFIWNFSRVNRRMHNKAFIVDGSIAIMGGRNIAEEYFDLKPQQRFDDFETLTFGEVVPEIADSFDTFWNSSLAVPMEAIHQSDSPQRRQRWLALMDDMVSGKHPSPYTAAMKSPFLQRILTGDIRPYIATADLKYDDPEKLLASRHDPQFRVLEAAVLQQLKQATKEIIIVTPYLVPRDLSNDLLKEARARGVRVVLVTNSLSSTNHVAVHSAYAPRRKGLLEAGAEIYEIKVDGGAGPGNDRNQVEHVTLHTKALVIDRQQLLIGSLNFDPRSIEINTEIGLFINSPAAASAFSELVLSELPRYAYRLTLSDKGQLRWHNEHDGTDQVLGNEPDTSGWLRFKAGFYGLLPLDNQL
jgi:putative cardiolipin synthase